MGEHCAHEPCRVGEEVPRGDVLKAGTLFQVLDGELDGGMLSVERVDVDCVASEVGDEAEVAPLAATSWPGDRSDGCAAR